MGTFTSITHPKGDRELQIQTGYDSCDKYCLGDTVRFYINKDVYRYGGIFDGVYQSTSDQFSIDDWVIIKNRKVLAIRSKRYKERTLKKQYKIKESPKNLWTEKAYKEHLKLQDKLKKEEKKFDKSIRHLSSEEKTIAIFSRPLLYLMQRESIARKVFLIEKKE